jgi:hypothetical protein
VGNRPESRSAGGAVWIADANGVILKVDPRTNVIRAGIPIDGTPNGLGYGLRAVSG